MSFILNALKKSEQERQHKYVKPLEQKLIEQQRSLEKKKNSTWLIILVLLNLGLLAYLIWSAVQEENEVIDNIKVTVSQNTEISKNKADNLEQIAVTQLINDDKQVSIAQQIKEQKEKTLKPLELKETIQAFKEKKLFFRKNVESKSVIKEKLIDKPKIQEMTVDKESELPFLSEMSYDFRRSVPTLDINVFVYSDNEDDRFVMIDMERYQTGQNIGEGVVLKEIRKNSIIVEYNNKTFQVIR